MKKNKYDLISSHKRTIIIDIKTREDKEYYYVSLWFNDMLIKEYKGKDYYKAKNKIYYYIMSNYNITIF